MLTSLYDTATVVAEVGTVQEFIPTYNINRPGYPAGESRALLASGYVVAEGAMSIYIFTTGGCPVTHTLPGDLMENLIAQYLKIFEAEWI